MESKAPIYLSIVAFGFVLAIASEFLGKSKFAQEHKTLNFFAGLAVIVAICWGSVELTHDFGGLYLPLIGFMVVAKINELRSKSRQAKETRAALQKSIDEALAARKDDQAVEIELGSVSEELRHAAIDRCKKLGLTVETVKNEGTGQLRLRLSGKITAS